MDGQFFKGSICQCPIQTVCFTRNEYEKSVFLLKSDQKLLLKTEGSAIVLFLLKTEGSAIILLLLKTEGSAILLLLLKTEGSAILLFWFFYIFDVLFL
jgi:hypothetical protein